MGISVQSSFCSGVQPELFYIGLTHQSAPLRVREQLRADRERQAAMLAEVGDFAAGQMLLATCERFEVYATTYHTDARRWTAMLERWFGFPPALLNGYVRTLRRRQAAEHLVRVAAGLESRILGERQILGQVRNAFQLAQDQSCLDAHLSALARSAIRAGKRVRQETAINAGSRSIVTVAMEWLSQRRLELADRAVVVVGNGRLAALVADQVAARKPRRLVIIGRNESRAADLATRHGGESFGIGALAAAVAGADAVITCTTSPSYLIDAALLGADRSTALLLIDLSVPRNVDPNVSGLSGVRLAHLDEMVTREPSEGAAADVIPQAEGIVRDELDAFLQWQRERQAAPRIAELLRAAAATTICKRTLHEQIMRLKAGVVL